MLPRRTNVRTLIAELKLSTTCLAAMQGLEKEVQSKLAESALAKAKKDSFDPVATLHPDMPQLLKLISKNAKAFKSPPIGPIGLYVGVKPEYAHLGPAVELGIHPANMISFIVYSGPDEVKMRELVNSIKPDPRIRVVPLARLIRFAIRTVEPSALDVDALEGTLAIV